MNNNNNTLLRTKVRKEFLQWKEEERIRKKGEQLDMRNEFLQWREEIEQRRENIRKRREQRRIKVREDFLQWREEEKIREEREYLKKQQLLFEINNQNNELQLMRDEEIRTKRVEFYKKLNVTNLNMYVEYLFNCHYDI